MINSLINMHPVIKETPRVVIPSNATICQYANAFINGMGETQRNRFKKMLESGIQCGLSIAESYGIDYNEFIDEVKKQLKVGDTNEL